MLIFTCSQYGKPISNCFLIKSIMNNTIQYTPNSHQRILFLLMLLYFLLWHISFHGRFLYEFEYNSRSAVDSHNRVSYAGGIYVPCKIGQKLKCDKSNLERKCNQSKRNIGEQCQNVNVEHKLQNKHAYCCEYVAVEHLQHEAYSTVFELEV